jgi:adenine specific DNA methylase Mod
MDVAIGDENETIGKDQSTLEMVAYRDMWGKGTDSYLHMMYERLVLMRELLSDTGSIYVHVGPYIASYVKLILDDIFGLGNAVSEIAWKRQTAHSDSHSYANLHEMLFLYTKTEHHTFNIQHPLHAKTH